MKLLVTAVLTVALTTPAAVTAQDSFPVAREIAVLKADVETLKRRVADLERLVSPPKAVAPAPKAVAPVAEPTVTWTVRGTTAAGGACVNGQCEAPRFAPVRGFFGRWRN
jgi:hypothetical protein